MWRNGQIPISAVLAFLVLVFSRPASAATTFTVTNTSDSGSGSLRQALLYANARSDPSSALVAFNIPKSDPGYGLHSPGVWTIQPLTGLPNITKGGVVIDGSTQRDNQGVTNPSGLAVEVDGSALGAGLAVFYLASSNNTICALALNNAGWGIVISGLPASNASNNFIKYNFIGTDANGSIAWPNVYGIGILGAASGNFIQDNYIAGNTLDGIYLSGNGTEDNTIINNRIGENRLKGTGLPNGGNGITLKPGSQRNHIGIADDLTCTPNLILSSGQHGIEIDGAYNNWIECNQMGGLLYPYRVNAFGSDGVVIAGGASATNFISNTVLNSNGHGVYLSDSGTTASIAYNFICSNALHGVAVYNGVEQSHIGYNEILRNGWTGVAIVGSHNNTVEHNAIGTEHAHPLDPYGNDFYGVAVVNGAGNTIGPGNIIAFNGLATGSDGVRIDGAVSLRNRITQNSIYSNGGKGIRNINGGNAQLLIPAIYAATCSGLIGMAGSTSTVEIFSDSADEGRFYEGTTHASWITPSFEYQGAFRGPYVTATATDSSGNTSEFSPPFAGTCFRLRIPLLMK